MSHKSLVTRRLGHPSTDGCGMVAYNVYIYCILIKNICIQIFLDIPLTSLDNERYRRSADASHLFINERLKGPPGPALFDSAFGLVAHLYLAASVTQASLRAANIKQNVAICTSMSHSQYFCVVQVMTNRRNHMVLHAKLPSKLLTPLIDRMNIYIYISSTYLMTCIQNVRNHTTRL